MSAAEPRYRLIACEVLLRECSAAISASPAIVDPEFLPKGLHDIGEAGMSSRLRAAIDAVDATRYDAILLAYGLCNNGTRGLSSPLPLVLPRAHDCITLLLGSRRRYAEHFAANPGTFYKSAGWIERDTDPDASPASVTARLGITHDRAALVRQYGEENADYLMATMGDWLSGYSKISFIDTGVGDTARYRKTAATLAAEKGWEMEEVAGSRVLLERLCAGDWPADDFLVVEPGERIEASWDDAIVRAEKRD